MKADQREKLKQFVADPNWNVIEKYFEDHIEPLKDIMTIDDNQAAEIVLAELKGRKQTIKAFTDFIESARSLLYQETTEKTSFK